MGKIKQSMLQNKIIFRQVYTIDNLIVVMYRYYEKAFYFNFYYIYENSLERTSCAGEISKQNRSVVILNIIIIKYITKWKFIKEYSSVEYDESSEKYDDIMIEQKVMKYLSFTGYKISFILTQQIVCLGGVNGNGPSQIKWNSNSNWFGFVKYLDLDFYNLFIFLHIFSEGGVISNKIALLQYVQTEIIIFGVIKL